MVGRLDDSLVLLSFLLGLNAADLLYLSIKTNGEYGNILGREDRCTLIPKAYVFKTKVSSHQTMEDVHVRRRRAVWYILTDDTINDGRGHTLICHTHFLLDTKHGTCRPVCSRNVLHTRLYVGHPRVAASTSRNRFQFGSNLCDRKILAYAFQICHYFFIGQYLIAVLASETYVWQLLPNK